MFSIINCELSPLTSVQGSPEDGQRLFPETQQLVVLLNAVGIVHSPAFIRSNVQA